MMEVSSVAEYRLFQMVYYLMDKGNTTAPELAEKFEVSIRTIYRDIDILSSAGIPVYTTQGKGGGIFLSENFILNRSLISEEEQNQILAALQGLSGVDEKNNQALLNKPRIGSRSTFQIGIRKMKNNFRFYKKRFFKKHAFVFIILAEESLALIVKLNH